MAQVLLEQWQETWEDVPEYRHIDDRGAAVVAAILVLAGEVREARIDLIETIRTLATELSATRRAT